MNARHRYACLVLAGTMLSSGQAQAAAPVSAAEAEALRSEIEVLRARLDALEKRLSIGTAEEQPAGSVAAPPVAEPMAATAAKPASAAPLAGKAAIQWKGSPQITEGDRSFKVKGRIQADAGYVSSPKGSTDRGLGFSSEMRRIRLGGEGSIGAGIGYKLELELSDNAVDLVDTYISYAKGPWTLRLGNQNPPWSLDELTGDTSGSVMERAAFTDAFNFERRLGLTAQYRKGALLGQAGVFTDDISALANSSDGPSGGDENNSYSLHARLVFAPRLGPTQLHLAGSAHWRRLGRLEEAGVRYRQRPYLHGSNTRPIGTPGLRPERELGYGAEFAVINGRWHGAGEVFVQRALGGNLPGHTFWGGYAEAGYFLTRGDSRDYSDGQFGATKPARPMDAGGPGAVQLTVRYDYLDLNDKAIVGGTQNGYIAALVWTPVRNLRFNLNYAYLSYDDAVALPSGDRSYDLHVLGTRFEFDF